MQQTPSAVQRGGLAALAAFAAVHVLDCLDDDARVKVEWVRAVHAAARVLTPDDAGHDWVIDYYPSAIALLAAGAAVLHPAMRPGTLPMCIAAALVLLQSASIEPEGWTFAALILGLMAWGWWQVTTASPRQVPQQADVDVAQATEELYRRYNLQ